MAELVQYYGTGRRKTAIARVYLRPGSGDVKVNGKPFDQYFVTEAQRASAPPPESLALRISFSVVSSPSKEARMFLASNSRQLAKFFLPLPFQAKPITNSPGSKKELRFDLLVTFASRNDAAFA